MKRRITGLALTTALTLLAAPASLAQLANLQSVKPFSQVYRLDEGSFFSEDCLPPCLCPIWLNGDMRGTFALQLTGATLFTRTYAVEDVNWTVEQYAVINVDWQVWNYFGAKSISVRGFGNFTRISGVAGWWSRMELDLSMGGATFEHFDSGGANDTVPFPTILTELSINGKYCYDKVFEILAAPAKYVALPMLGG